MRRTVLTSAAVRRGVRSPYGRTGPRPVRAVDRQPLLRLGRVVGTGYGFPGYGYGYGVPGYGYGYGVPGYGVPGYGVG